MTVAQPREKPEVLTETSQTNSENVIIPHGEIDSDEPELESSLHLQQIITLLTSLEWLWSDRQDYFVAGNLTIYYSTRQLKSQDFRGPDLFVVLDTESRPRKSWTVWEEDGKYPDLIIEILSDSTASVDRGLKKRIYQNTFRTPDYFLFDPESLALTGYHLIEGKYETIKPNEQGLLWSQSLGLSLGVYQEQLRWFTAEGELVNTPQETALQEKETRLKVEQEKQLAEQRLQEIETLLSRYQERYGNLNGND